MKTNQHTNAVGIDKWPASQRIIQCTSIEDEASDLHIMQAILPSFNCYASFFIHLDQPTRHSLCFFCLSVPKDKTLR